MTPFRPLVIDNRTAGAQFIDGNPITDGMANFAASLINAPIAASQIRRQRQLDDMEQAFRSQAVDRQARLDEMQQLWHDQGTQRQSEQDKLAALWHDQGAARADEMQKANIGNMQADNARQTASMVGTGVNNAAARGIDAIKALGGLFRRGGGATPASGVWYTFKGDDDATYKLNRQTGEIVPAVPAQTAAVPIVPAADSVAATAAAPSEGPGDGFLTLRRSGQPGVKTLGDVAGGVLDGWDPQALGQQDPRSLGIAPAGGAIAAPAAPTAGPDAGMRAWHQFATANPAEFRRQLLEIKGSDPARYQNIVATLRAMNGGQ